MNETTEIILFMLGGVGLCIAAGTGAVMMLLGKISDIRERVIALEIRFELSDRGMARVAHSPHNPYGWDEKIDKYLNRHYEMTMAEWQEWFNRCEVVINDESKPMEDRILAVQLAQICRHKMMLPPPLRKAIEQKANAVEDKLGKPNINEL